MLAVFKVPPNVKTTNWLAANIPLELRILQQWLKAGVLDGGMLLEVNAGTPQGAVLLP